MNDQGKAAMKTKKSEWKVPQPSVISGRLQRVEGMQYLDRGKEKKK